VSGRGVDAGEARVGPDRRLRVADGGALGAQVGDSGVEVVDLEAHGVQALAALGDLLREPAAGVFRLHQLDEGVADRQARGLEPGAEGVVQLLVLGKADAVLPLLEGVGEVGKTIAYVRKGAKDFGEDPREIIAVSNRCAHLGCPIVGDDVYGKSRTIPLGKGSPARTVTVSRFLLHAFHLAFPHPVTGKPLSFTIPDPPEFAAFRASVRETYG